MRTYRALIAVAAAALAIAAWSWTGRAQAGGHQAQHKEPELEVFCSGLSAGQLCLHGSPNVLKLDGAKKQRWTEAAGRYNKAVDAATKQLLQEAKATLSPDEYARVEKWFDKSLNVLMNQQLLARQH